MMMFLLLTDTNSAIRAPRCANYVFIVFLLRPVCNCVRVQHGHSGGGGGAFTKTSAAMTLL